MKVNKALYLLIGDGSSWLVATKEAVIGPPGGYDNEIRDAHMSSMNSNPHTVRWMNRPGESSDPIISLKNYNQNIGMLYVEAAYDGHYPTIRDHGGANVYIRNNGEVIKIFVEQIMVGHY